MKDLQDILPDGGYDLDLIESEYHRELEVEQDGKIIGSVLYVGNYKTPRKRL